MKAGADPSGCDDTMNMAVDILLSSISTNLLFFIAGVIPFANKPLIHTYPS